jgi:hypothetical protein
MVAFTGRSLLGGLFDLVAGRRDDALLAYVEPLCAWAFVLGRYIPNEPEPQPTGSIGRRLERLLIG